ncbi:hypothetical protein MML48_8g00001099 [Holotrichia oblita]|uniref:Uncharacterized protein n=1 Tax=Holotrichia oblita TaxID=644536 RepID=A0ACB9SL77_HOLOL|nr:hypothetical protein MML48_8g00001099 [Holotrichia oblita]
MDADLQQNVRTRGAIKSKLTVFTNYINSTIDKILNSPNIPNDAFEFEFPTFDLDNGNFNKSEVDTMLLDECSIENEDACTSDKCNDDINKENESLDPNEYFIKFQEIVNSAVITFISKLYDTLIIPRSYVQFVIDCILAFISTGSFQLIRNLIDYYKKICKCTTLPLDLLYKMLHCFENCFENFNTEYKRHKYFDKSKYTIKPVQYKMGRTTDISRKRSQTSLISKPLSCAYIPIVENLQLFLELPGVLETILNYQVHLQGDNPNVLTNVIQGTLWQSKKHKFYSSHILPLLIFFDDLQIGNPLGSHAQFTKVGAVYYSIPTVPPEYGSKLKNIFVAQIFHSVDKNTCGNEKTFKMLIQELQNLEKFGVVINGNNGLENIYFCVILIIGDNLGLHTIFGLSESFSASHYCRFCIGNKNYLTTLDKEDVDLLRNKDEYETHIDQKLYGVKERCIWNDLHYFHVYENMYCDVMHDLLEGVHRYDMAKLLKYFISNHYFTLETINRRIKYNLYECNEKNILPSVKQEHITNGAIICSAVEMHNFVRNFRFIIGDLIPFNNEYWQFYLLLLNITDILMSTEVSTDDITKLETLIPQHNRLLIGPLSVLSCIRFEAKHRELKTVANSTRCRINIPITIANRLRNYKTVIDT